VVAVLCDNGEGGGDEAHGFENEVGTFRPTVVSSSTDVTLSRNAEPRCAGADEGGFGAAENTESVSGKESVESAVWGRRERRDEEADRGEMGGKSARGVESVESAVCGRWGRLDKEADRGEMGGESVRGVERETLDVEKKEEIKLMFLTLSKGAVFGRRPSLTTKSESRRQ
jgi:hypothetical protein